jgi:hypothetical protein
LGCALYNGAHYLLENTVVPDIFRSFILSFGDSPASGIYMPTFLERSDPAIHTNTSYGAASVL